MFLPGGMAEFDEMLGSSPIWSRPARPPKPEPRKLSDEISKLAAAATVFVDTGREDPDSEEFRDALGELCAVANAFKWDATWS